MSLSTGQPLSFYEILGPLGAGGMGEVYLARDTRLDREVAIKMLPEELAEDEERLRRFEREAKTLASLNHPNVAGIYSIDQQDDTCFLAMELVSGEDLEERLKRGALPLDEAFDICRQIAEGLEAAHEAGVVHRDLKPANVRITAEGAVKVLDFGLAKPIGPMARTSGTTSAQSDSFVVTSEGMILGTPTYMSPEQARGKPVDRRTDIWAFGCVLYECLTGERAFQGDAFGDLIAAILEHDVDLGALPDTTPPRVRELIARCLTKDPRTRLRDLGEARILLEKVRSGENLGGGSGSEPARRQSPRWAIAAALVLGGAVALGATALTGGWSSPQSRLTVRTSIDLPQGLVLDPVDRAIALSPDGSRVALVAEDTADGSKQMYLRSLNHLEVSPVPGTEGASYPFWSPDGRSIGFFADLKLKRIDLPGGIVRTLCDAPAGRGADWSQHGFIVFAPSANSGLLEVPEDGGEPRAYTTLSSHTSTHRLPHFLPDGRGILYLAIGTLPAGEDSTAPDDRSWTPLDHGVAIQAFDPETGETRKIADSATEAFFIEPGFLAYMRDWNLMLQPFDPEALELTGEPAPVAADVRLDWERLFLQLDIVAGGNLVYAEVPSEPGARFGWLDRHGVETPIPAEPLNVTYARVSPDGLRAAVAVQNRAGAKSVVLIDLERGIKTPVNPMGAYASHPIWSEDSKRLVLQTLSSNSHYNLGVVDARLGAEPLLLTEGYGFTWAPDAFTPDGQVLLSRRSQVNKRGDLMLVDPSGDDPTAPISPFLVESTNDSNARMSPDGQWIVFATFPAGAESLPTASGATLSISDYPSTGRWQITRPDAEVRTWGFLSEREIFWQDAAGEVFVVSFTPNDGDGPSFSTPKRLFEERLFSRDGGRILDYSIAREQFLVARPAGPTPPARIVFVSDWSAAR